MNIVLEYTFVIIGTLVANVLLSKISGALQQFGMMNAIAFDVAMTPNGLKNLRAFFAAATDGETPAETSMKFLQRARLWGQIPTAITHALLAVAAGILLASPFPDAAWIPGLWVLCVLFYAFTMARMSAWWLIRSHFINAEKLATEIDTWHAKNQ